MPKGKGASGANREAESTDAPGRGGLLRSSDETGVMPAERRERAIAIWLGSTGNGRNPMFNGRRQPSRGGTSRMTRECQVRFCEGLGVNLPGPTRQSRHFGRPRPTTSGLPRSGHRQGRSPCPKGARSGHSIISSARASAFIRATLLSEDPQSTASRLIVRPERYTPIL